MKIAISLCFTLFLTFWSLHSLAQEKLIKPTLKGTFFRYFEKSMKKWQGLDSVAFTYDAQGNKTSLSEFTGDDIVYATTQRKYTYNSKNQMTTENLFFWDYNKNKWCTTPQSKVTYTYNNIDSLTSILYESKDSLGWSNSSKWEYTYDSNNHKIQELGYMWDTLTNSWSNKGCEKFTMTYVNNRLTSKTNYVWDYNNNQQKMVSRTNYTYTSNGLLETSSNLVWDGVNTWHNSMKDSLVYDMNNLKITEYGFSFDDVKTKGWNKVYKNEYTLNVNNQISSILQTYWNSKINMFSIDVNTKKSTYNYNKDQQVTSVYDKMYDTISKQFTDYSELYFYYEKTLVN